MSESPLQKHTSTQKTVKRNDNEARLVITFEIEFTDKARQEAPRYSNKGVDILRDLIREMFRDKKGFIGKFNQELVAMGRNDILSITDVQVQAAP